MRGETPSKTGFSRLATSWKSCSSLSRVELRFYGGSPAVRFEHPDAPRRGGAPNKTAAPGLIEHAGAPRPPAAPARALRPLTLPGRGVIGVNYSCRWTTTILAGLLGQGRGHRWESA